MNQNSIIRNKSTGDRLGLAIVFLFSIVFLFPFYWMITGSFKLQMVAVTIPPEWFPKKTTMENWERLFRMPAFRWLINGTFVSFITMSLVCLTSAMAGYSLSKKQYPGQKFIFWMFVAVMTLPKQILLVPLFTIISKLNWIDTYKGLIAPAVGWPFGVFLMKQFTQTLPTELLEAAKIDGCSEWRIFWNIVIPLVKPGLGALAIFTFMSSWNDYFWQLIVIRSTPMKTLPLGVAGVQLEHATDYGILMSGATLSSLPMIIIFLLFQKYFTQGITMGAIKG